MYAWLSAKNQATLKKVESAIVALCLDEAEPSTPTEWARTLIHGDCQNRWFEKLNIIVCKNKYAGVNSEHSSLDGHNLLRLVNFLVEDSRVSVEAAGPAWETATPQPEELTWKLDNRLLTAVDDACSNAEAMCESIELELSCMWSLPMFGSPFLVAGKAVQHTQCSHDSLTLCHFFWGVRAPLWCSLTVPFHLSFSHGLSPLHLSCTSCPRS